MSFDERSLRDALGQFATGVCLVTLVDEAGVAQAMTVNSFASVSLDPPLVLWSLQKDCDLYASFTQTPDFAISMLSDEQQGHSQGYAQKDGHALQQEHYVAGENGAPLIRNALANFECRLEQIMDGGDHSILLARVLRIESRNDGAPLVFYGGAYRGLA